MTQTPRRATRQLPSTCPECGATAVVPIVYGYPGEDLMGAYERGEVELGGCVIQEEQPYTRCTTCGHRW